MGYVLGWDSSEPEIWAWAWVDAEFVRLPALLCLCHQGQLLSVVTSEVRSSSRVLRPQHDLKQHLRPGTFELPLVVTRASDINTVSFCIRITYPDMARSGNMGPDVIMASGGSTGHSDQYVPCWQQSPQTSIWSHVTSHTTDICMAFGSNSGHGY